MFDTRTVKTNSNNSNNLNQNSDTEFFKLKSELLLNYPVREETLNALEVQIGFDLGFNNITAQQILLEMEAYFISNNMDNKTINEKIIKDVLIECVGKLIKKSEKDKAKKRPQVNRNFAAIETNIKNPNNMNNLTQNNLVSSNINETATQILNEINYVTVSKKEIAIENYSTFSEKSHLHPTILNSREISYSFFSNFEIKEYSILPKDEETYMEEYKNYFKMAKAVFMESLKIEADDPLMDADKFILLVTFENTEGKPLITDIVLVDPLQDYKKFFLKIENESCLNDYYFFSGQLIYVEGLVKNNDLFAQKIVYGMPILEYGISEPYVRGFFQESAPYLIYALNGPILNKNDIDFGLFIATLRNLANDDPHALILSGPILNIENAAISSGDIKFTNNNDENNANYFELFEFFLNKLNEIFFNKRTTVILCPALSDVISYYPLPQPAYNLSYMKNVNSLELVKRGKLKLIGNPQIFQLNEIICSVANFDFVKDMISNSIRSQQKIPRDSSLEMILQQKSFYPVLNSALPTDEGDKIEKTIGVDYRKLSHLHLGAIPDIIITNSKMNPFVRKVGSTLFVNCSSLYKDNSPGYFAKIVSYPPNNLIGFDVINRLKVELCTISNK